MEEQNVAIRLKGFIDSMGLSPSQFADECGIPRPTLSQLLSGRNKKISDIIVGQIHRVYPDLSVVWLLFGEGPMLNQSLSTESVDMTPKSMENVKDGVLSADLTFSPSKNPSNSPSKFENENVRGLTTPSDGVQNIDLRLIEAQNQITDLQRQIDKIRKNPRKVSQITIYYDDSTFETFVPLSESCKP